MTMLSVIVCTFRRPDLLERCVRGCLEQRLDPGDALEVLVVDNDSSPDVEERVARLASRTHQLRYIAQPLPGLSASRRVGASVARGDIVAYLDDDAVPIGPGWARAYLDAFSERHVGSAGGPVVPDLDGIEPPRWLSPHVEAKLTVLDISRPVPMGELRRTWPYRSVLAPMGANIAFRRDLVPAFEDALGRTGSGLASRDELPGLRAVQARGLEVRLVPDAAVFHRIERARLTPEWILNRFRAEGRSRPAERIALGQSPIRAAAVGTTHALASLLLAPAILATRHPGRLLAVRCRGVEALAELRGSILLGWRR